MTNHFNIRSLATVAAGASLALLVHGPQTAQAATLISFDDQAAGPFPNPLLTNGFKLIGGSFISNGASFCTPECPDNGTPYVNVLADADMQPTLKLTALDGGAFSFLQFEGAEVEADEPRDEFTTGSDFWAESIAVLGRLANGSVVTTRFDLDQIQDGSGSANDFQTFVLPNRFTDLVALELTGEGTNLASWFSVDNLLLARVETPEPESVPEPTMLIGLILLGGLGFVPQRQA